MDSLHIDSVRTPARPRSLQMHRGRTDCPPRLHVLRHPPPLLGLRADSREPRSANAWARAARQHTPPRANRLALRGGGAPAASSSRIAALSEREAAAARARTETYTSGGARPHPLPQLPCASVPPPAPAALLRLWGGGRWNGCLLVPPAFAGVYGCVWVWVRAHTHTHACMYARTHACTHQHVRARKHARTYLRLNCRTHRSRHARAVQPVHTLGAVCDCLSVCLCVC